MLTVDQFSSVAQSCLTLQPHGAARQAFLSITNSRSLLKLMSIESVMPSNHLILCHPLLLPPSIFPSIRVFSNESVLRIRWPKYWSFSFSISPFNEYSGLISFRIDWLDLLAVQGTLKCREPAREIPPMTRSCGEAWWARWVRLQGFPLGFPEHLPPKTRVCLPYCTVLSTLLPLKGINLGLQSTVSCI